MSSSLVSAVTIHNQLLSGGFYLADSSMLDRVEWGMDGRKTVLLVKPTAPTADSDMRPALLSAIVVLSEQGFFLTSDANWRGPSTISPHLYDAKGSCVGTPLQVNPFRDDFALLIEHARLLQTQTATSEESLSVEFVRDNCLKFRHILFEHVSPDPDEDDECNVSLDDWPVENEVAADELEKMKATHRALPLPAYNIDNNLIPPSAYCRKLQGALVEIHFTLAHCSFKNKDAFSADIHTIRVLRVPHTVSSITKCRLPNSFKQPTFSSPSSFVQGKASSSKRARHH